MRQAFSACDVWKVWYDGGSTFSSADGPPENAPKRGVQAIACADAECGRYICRSNDFYIWSVYDGQPGWQGVDYFGLWDYLQEPGAKIVLFGRTIGNAEYRQTLNRVMNDPELPDKVCWHAEERRD